MIVQAYAHAKHIGIWARMPTANRFTAYRTFGCIFTPALDTGHNHLMDNASEPILSPIELGAASLQPIPKKPRREKLKRLSHRDKAFVAAYVASGGNASKAAIACGFPEKWAKVKGSHMLKRPTVKAELAEFQRDLYEKSRFSAEKTLAKLSAIIHFDPRSMFGPDGNLKPISELGDDEAFALAGVDVAIRNVKAGDGVQDQVYKIKWADRLRAVELAMKHFGLISPAIEVNVNLGIAERLNAARGRIVDAEVVKD